MSNFGHILDKFESWEEIDENGLSNQLNQIRIQQRHEQNTTNLQFQQPTNCSGTAASFLILNNDESSGNYSKPVVKILRRPTQEHNSKQDQKPKAPIKTLQQREQEYAEARLRILGSAKNPEDELEAALEKKLQTKLLSEQKNFCETSTIGTRPFGTSGDQQQEQLSPQKQFMNGIMKPQENIIRNPKGPDGTKGFHIRR